MIDPWFAFAALTVGAVVTYAWRGLGVLVAGRLDPNGRLIAWVGCVAYALLAALIARMIVLPLGVLADTPLTVRLAATALAVAAWYAAGRRVLVAIVVGVGSLSGLVALVGVA